MFIHRSTVLFRVLSLYSAMNISDVILCVRLNYCRYLTARHNSVETITITFGFMIDCLFMSQTILQQWMCKYLHTMLGLNTGGASLKDFNITRLLLAGEFYTSSQSITN